MKQPPLITYNLKERGRDHCGVERDFDIKAIVDSINGPATQERVKTRAMLGYFGHNIRRLFGMEPTESGVVAGKYNEIEPAIVTTRITGFMDGTIEHQTEFLDNGSGKRAAVMFKNRIGGFSSAIDENKPEMFGFDYVLDPNYSTNRGFALDSTSMTLDEVKNAVQNEEDAFFFALLEQKDAEIANLAASLDSAQEDNEQLSSMLASYNSVQDISPEVDEPVIVSLDSANQIKNDMDAFSKETKLPGFVEPQVVVIKNGITDKYMDRMGY